MNFSTNKRQKGDVLAAFSPEAATSQQRSIRTLPEIGSHSSSINR